MKTVEQQEVEALIAVGKDSYSTKDFRTWREQQHLQANAKDCLIFGSIMMHSKAFRTTYIRGADGVIHRVFVKKEKK